MKKFDNSPGIDYSHGLPMANGRLPNRDHETGIRYGVIHVHMVTQAWSDSSEAEYPCGECDAWNHDDDCCDDDSFDCEPVAWYYKDDGYEAFQSRDDCDIFVCKSPFYTYAQFCSPCAPGACYLANPIDCMDHETRQVLVSNRCYCLGPDWFDNDYEPCPYPVWRVDTDELVYEPK